MQRTKGITLVTIKLHLALMAIMLALILSGCSQTSSQDEISVSNDAMSAPLPAALRALALDETNLVVKVVVDGGTPQDCTNLSVDQGNGTFSCSITLPTGAHKLALVYSVIDAAYGIVRVATTSEIDVVIIAGETTTTDFSTATLAYDDPDNDSYSSIVELDNGSDPFTNEPPAVTATTPNSEATGEAVNISVTVTFSDPMDQATLEANFTLADSAGPVNGAVTYDDAGRTATLVSWPPMGIPML